MQNTKMFLADNYLMVILATTALLVLLSISSIMVTWHHGDLNQYSIQLTNQASSATTVVAPGTRQ